MTIFFELKITPNSSKQKCTLDKNKQPKCYLTSQPEKGKANSELIKLLSKKLNIAKSKIIIITGKTTRKKKLKIDTDLTYENLLKKLINE